MERLDDACRIGVGSAGRVSGAMDTVRYEPCPSRNGSGCSTAGHKTKASAQDSIVGIGTSGVKTKKRTIFPSYAKNYCSGGGIEIESPLKLRYTLKKP